MLRKIFHKERVADALLAEAEDATHLDRKDLIQIIRTLLKDDPDNHDDMYSIFLQARAAGHFLENERRGDTIARLRCLVALDREVSEKALSTTTPGGNILHALQRFMSDGTISQHAGKQAILQFVLSCSHSLAASCLDRQISIVEMIDAAERERRITKVTAQIGKYAFFQMVDPFLVEKVRKTEGIPITESTKLYEAVQKTGRGLAKVALIREWRDIPRDEINNIIRNHFDHSLEEVKTEYLAQQLMKQYHVDRTHAKDELNKNKGDMAKAAKSCEAHSNASRNALQADAIVPTRDTKCSPNVTPHTRIIAILGLFETDESPNTASPSQGDGWIVSDFYLWMNVLSGMGRMQQWITTMTPQYLINKYGREEKVTLERIDDDPNSTRPMQTKWATGFVHGDPFEERKVVLDEAIAARLQDRVTMGPKGAALRGFFLEKLEDTLAEAAKSGDTVLIMMFAHGDYDSQGGLYLGVDIFGTFDIADLLKPSHIAAVLSKYPHVKCTIYMTSCFSGHWVESTEFSGSQIKPFILAGAKSDQETFGFVWSHSQRHAGGLFSGATISELLQEPIEIPQEPDQDSSREYRQVINSLVCEMHRLCLPSNIESGYGSSPVFSDNESQEKFWRRTGYRLHDYKANYDKLKTLPASDPHPKRDKKRFHADFVDGKDPAIVAWEKRHPGILDEDYPEATGGYGSTSRGLVSLATMKYLIRIYFDSNPGFHTQEHRVLLPSIRAFFEKSLSHERKLFLRQQLVHRLQANQQANQHCKLLGLYRVPAIEKWTPGQTSSSYDYATFSKFAERIAHSGLYHWKPSSGQGVVYYRKPSQYLAAAMALAGYCEPEVDDAIKSLMMHRFGDTLTSQYVKTARYSNSIMRVRKILKDSLGAARTAPRSRGSRPPLSGISWH